MNKPAHRLMGRLFLESVRDQYGILLHENSFLLGNVLPDYTFSFLTRPHKFSNCGSLVKRKMEALLRRELTSACAGRKVSRKLGVLCHYYADFFCRCHNPGFEDDVLAHMKYERDLYLYLLNSSLAFVGLFRPVALERETVSSQIFGRFEMQHADYLQSDPSFWNDCIHCYGACMEMLGLILHSVLAERPDELEPSFSTLLKI